MIRILKKLCKAPFRMFASIISFFHYLLSLLCIAAVKRRIKANRKGIDKPINVVFVVQYIPGWNKLEPIYRKMQNDPRFHPVIVCVPLQIQNHKLLNDDFNNDTYDYFVAHEYSAVNALSSDGKWFDLRTLEPDLVFHSRPYNGYMPKCYTSSRIRKYALLCNVLYGPNLTKSGQEVTLNWDYFRDVYCYFAFDQSEKEYYEHKFRLGISLNIQKCAAYGAIGPEQLLQAEEPKKQSKYRKTVMWTPRWSTDPFVGGSNFFLYRDTMFALVEQTPDVYFIFRPHPMMLDNFLKTGEMTEDEVTEFKEYCERKENLTLDQSKEYTATFWQTDFLISDVSGMLPEYFVTEKPIIYCHSDATFVFAEYSEAMLGSCYTVHDPEALKQAFYNLCDGQDTKKVERIQCIDTWFSDVRNNSSRALEFLLKDLSGIAEGRIENAEE